MTTPLKLEVGKTYRARNGNFVRIDMHDDADRGGLEFYSKAEGWYTADGKSGGGGESDALIAEWTDAPTPEAKTLRDELAKEVASFWLKHFIDGASDKYSHEDLIKAAMRAAYKTADAGMAAREVKP